MKSERLEYTLWLYFIGGIGLLLGAQGIFLIAVLVPMEKLMNEITIICSFLLVSAILFLFVKRGMTYLMYTGMFAVFCVFRTFTPLILGPPIPDWTFFIGSVPYWLCFGYLIYKYLDFSGLFGDKRSYKEIYEEPYKRNQKQNSDKIYRITDSFVEIVDWSKQVSVLLITDKAESGSGQRYALKSFEKDVVPIISSLVKELGIRLYWSNIESVLLGNIRRSEVRGYLKKNKLAFRGCFLFKNGLLMNYKKLGIFTDSAGYITAVIEILAEESARLKRDREEHGKGKKICGS